jgi:hypothetical protein
MELSAHCDSKMHSLIRFMRFRIFDCVIDSKINAPQDTSEDVQHYESVMLHYVAGPIKRCNADLN